MLGRYSGLSIGQYTPSFENKKTGENIQPSAFVNKKTGEVKTQLSIEDFSNYNEWEPIYSATTGTKPEQQRESQDTDLILDDPSEPEKPQGMNPATKTMIGVSAGIAGIILFSMISGD